MVPALTLLHGQGFEGPNDEYRKAREHYRQGRYKECLNECLKAFESTIKTICTKRGWVYDPGRDTASALITICVTNGLVPAFMQSCLTTIPTVRNKMGGHGQGPEPVEVPYFAEYLLHETIVFWWMHIGGCRRSRLWRAELDTGLRLRLNVGCVPVCE